MAVLGKAGGGAISSFPITFATSTTWACPVAMEAYVFVIGPGGAGAGSENNTAGRIQGGCAGGCAVSKLSLKAQNYAIVIGEGGVSADPAATYADGANGSAATTFTDSVGSAFTQMVGNAGAGGNSGQGSTVAAQTGGTATGGNLMNNTGGGVPAITADGRVTGGGAVGLWGPGADGQVSSAGLWYTGSPGYHWGPSAGGIGSDHLGMSGTMHWFAPPFNLQTTHQHTAPRPNSSTDSQRMRQNLSAGSMWSNHGWSESTTYGYTNTGTPLAGSGGYFHNQNYAYGGGASLGGGGGGMISQHSSATMSTCGGGHGGVIILPISMGS
jgi:hypothetical protein